MRILWHTEPCTIDGVSEHGRSKRPGTGEEGCSNEVTVEQEQPLNNTSDRFRREDISAVHAAHDSSGERTTEPKGNEFYMIQFLFSSL